MTGQKSCGHLFDGVPCLHGIIQAGLHGMGRVWLSDEREPRAGVMTCGDVLICAGEAEERDIELLRGAVCSDRREWVAWCPGQWRALLSGIRNFRVETRYAFDPGILPDPRAVRALLDGMPGDLCAVPLEGAWISWCRQHAWSRDFVSCYASADEFTAISAGVLLLRDDEPVSGASGYVSYPGGIEVQVQTRDDQQGKGYATLASAALLLRCHEKGIRATWDAANAASAAIAAKLGYRQIMPYEALIVPPSDAGMEEGGKA